MFKIVSYLKEKKIDARKYLEEKNNFIPVSRHGYNQIFILFEQKDILNLKDFFGGGIYETYILFYITVILFSLLICIYTL